MSSTGQFGSMSNHEIKDRLRVLTEQEQVVSARRGVVHREIDALRRELIDRLRDDGQQIITGEDFSGPGPAGSREPRRPLPGAGSGAAHADPGHDDSGDS
jgi:hypothetical protein